jgi:RNA polymerase sigma factor (sigma-70 family)
LTEGEFLENIKSNQGVIFKLVGLYANDSEEKKDLYQEILLQAWKGLPSFRGDAKFSTWLYRICLNTIFTLKRKVNRMSYTEDGKLEDISPHVLNQSVAAEETARLRMAMRRLPETDRAILSLHLDGYENSEIAAIIGITNNHVAVKLHRCKQQLSNLIKVKE